MRTLSGSANASAMFPKSRISIRISPEPNTWNGGPLAGFAGSGAGREDRWISCSAGTPSDRHVPISSNSKGRPQKVLLLAALLHNPEFLLLDGPFSGLDVNSALVRAGLIPQLASRGKVVLFSSHEMDTVERVCSRVVILHRQLVANDSIEHLRDLDVAADAGRHLLSTGHRTGHPGITRHRAVVEL